MILKTLLPFEDNMDYKQQLAWLKIESKFNIRCMDFLHIISPKFNAN